ncbi:hypothetical protein KFZ76_04525 [Methylovulum psychrotolerans]|uniref:hypothetical protein n=1 Tax=Methylovulum psychrotolerans TaxID=1704499 RepID=UPI001BFF8EEE|nr:hypothetical protein [Methylovulum psychrotolerans]MBT9096978.1 hypothetical protein [Methylovulum psychrotolerans]
MTIDWFFWKNLNQVALWQASFLACNIDPYKMDYDDIERFGLENDEAHKVLELLKSNLHKRQFFSPGILNIGDSNLHSVRLPEFAAWCLSIGMEIPPKLADLASPPILSDTFKNSKVSKVSKTTKAPPPISPLRYSPSSKPLPVIAAADYKTWCKADLWTVERGILLLLNAESLPNRNFRGCYDSPTEQALCDDFVKILEIAKGSIKIGILKTVYKSSPPIHLNEVLPNEFIFWAGSKGYSIPVELENLGLTKHVESGSDDKASETQTKLIKDKYTETEIDTDTSGRRDNQIKLICEIALRLGYEQLAIPEGGKVCIKGECLKSPQLFTNASFDHAWKEANKRNVISMQNKEKYL